jgi:hypothetical protein
MPHQEVMLLICFSSYLISRYFIYREFAAVFDFSRLTVFAHSRSVLLGLEHFFGYGRSRIIEPMRIALETEWPESLNKTLIVRIGSAT